MSIRLGAVAFLNARPLVVPLESSRTFELSYSVPSACAAELRSGQIDLGLIPAIDYARSQDPYYIVPHVAIASRGEVFTVRLFYRGALDQVARVALDISSLTSVALVRILLREKYQLAPEFVDAPPDLESMLERAEAALLIGDPVFRHVDAAIASLDLGREWTELTGDPFVFAFWAGRQGVLSPAQTRQLVQAGRAGREQIPAIARSFARESTGSNELYERYLREHIHFDLGAAELAGLRRFYGLAHEHGLIDSVPELRFYDMVSQA